MSKYVLISFFRADKSGVESWLVYGHIHAGHNESLGEFDAKRKAIDYCFQYGVPVMQGSNCTHIVEKLQPTAPANKPMQPTPTASHYGGGSARNK